MQPGNYTLVVQQGFACTRRFGLKKKDGTPFDLTGWTGQAQIRTTYSSKKVLAAAEVTIDGSPTDGILTIVFADDDTATLPTAGRSVWDLKIMKDPASKRLIKGDVVVEAEVSRDE